MFFSDDHLSDMEKINRIYKMLRAERRARLFWLFIKLSILGAVVFGFYYLGLPQNAEKKEELSNIIQTKMTEFITPMVGNMVQDLTENMVAPGQSSTTTTNRKRNNTATSPVVITPELLKAAQDMLNNQKK